MCAADVDAEGPRGPCEARLQVDAQGKKLATKNKNKYYHPLQKQITKKTFFNVDVFLLAGIIRRNILGNLFLQRVVRMLSLPYFTQAKISVKPALIRALKIGTHDACRVNDFHGFGPDAHVES